MGRVREGGDGIYVSLLPPGEGPGMRGYGLSARAKVCSDEKGRITAGALPDARWLPLTPSPSPAGEGNA